MAEQTDYVLKSPLDLLQQAAEVMDVPWHGKDSYKLWNITQWQLIVNCWAFNLPKDLVEQEVRLLVMIFEIPDAVGVDEIVRHQLSKRQDG